MTVPPPPPSAREAEGLDEPESPSSARADAAQYEDDAARTVEQQCDYLRRNGSTIDDPASFLVETLHALISAQLATSARVGQVAAVLAQALPARVELAPTSLREQVASLLDQVGAEPTPPGRRDGAALDSAAARRRIRQVEGMDVEVAEQFDELAPGTVLAPADIGEVWPDLVAVRTRSERHSWAISGLPGEHTAEGVFTELGTCVVVVHGGEGIRPTPEGLPCGSRELEALRALDRACAGADLPRAQVRDLLADVARARLNDRLAAGG